MYESRPWLARYGDVPRSLAYPQVTLYEAVAAAAGRVPDAVAIDFFDYQASYRELFASIDRAAAGFAALGMRAGDRIAIAMPTTPQGVIAVYAANKLGAVPVMIHPLSTPDEIRFYLQSSRSRFALTLDACFQRFAALGGKPPLQALILARIPDYLGAARKVGFWLQRGRKIPRVPAGAGVVWWRELLGAAHPPAPAAPASTHDTAVIMFSGGTTGEPKGVLLSNQNLISEGMQVSAWARMREGDAVLAVLPIFHGFGLGVCVNAALMAGGRSVLVPVFEAAEVARLIRSKRPSLLAGVPTLYDALARDPSLARADLSCLRATFSGADTLPRPVKERFERLVEERGGHVKLLEGYGLTEAVSAIMATPLQEYREGSIGVPFPDMLAKIVALDTTTEVEPGTEGEICICGPAVMQGYADAPAATAAVLRTHADGRRWLHTGDLGRMDADGFFYFTCRLKRMIKSSGFNVYPTQVEATLYRHPAVADACVIGVPDPEQIERVKAYVVLKDAARAGPQQAQELIEHCRAHLLKWSCPREVEFRAELPKTRIGKVDYKALARTEAAREAR
jgi:long-chain acyl-CoA synthetase